MESYKKSLGSAYPFVLEGAILVLHPLTLKEWALLDQVFEKQDLLMDTETMLYAIWLSVRKEDFALKRIKLNARIGKDFSLIFEIFRVISEISLPELPAKPEEKYKPPTQKEIRSIYNFFEKKGWLITEVANLTPYQVDFYLRAPGKKGVGIQVNSIAEAQKILENRRNKTHGI